MNFSIRSKTFAATVACMLLFVATIVSQETTVNTVGTEESAIVLDDSATVVPQEDFSNESPNNIWVLVRIVAVLLLVCAGIYGVVYLLKKSTGVNAASDPYLRVVSQLLLAPGKSIQVVTIGSQAFIVGVSENGIQYLTELSDKDLIDAMNFEADRNNNEPITSFSSIFSRFFPGGSARASKSAEPTPSDTKDSNPLSAAGTADFIKRQRERLQNAGRDTKDTQNTGRFE